MKIMQEKVHVGNSQSIRLHILYLYGLSFVLCRNKFVEFDMKPVCKKCYEKFPLELKKRLKKLAESLARKWTASGLTTSKNCIPAISTIVKYPEELLPYNIRAWHYASISILKFKSGIHLKNINIPLWSCHRSACY